MPKCKAQQIDFAKTFALSTFHLSSAQQLIHAVFEKVAHVVVFDTSFVSICPTSEQMFIKIETKKKMRLIFTDFSQTWKFVYTSSDANLPEDSKKHKNKTQQPQHRRIRALGLIDPFWMMVVVKSRTSAERRQLFCSFAPNLGDKSVVI